MFQSHGQNGKFIHFFYSAAGLANPDALFRSAIFDGVFLDTGCVVARMTR